jgi:serine/threonine protein kinase
MEYFPGRDLARVLKSEGALTPARGINLACQVCDALAAAHEKGVIHRDVKPGNVLVGQDDLVKLVDFGLAAVGQQMGSRLTKSGLLIGTPEYMAPEQISGQAVDGRADLYALGVLMYEMFSGTQPFAGENTVAILFQHLEGEVKPLSQVAPQVTPALERVVMSAMARNPDDRPATAVELRRLLINV